MLTIVVKKVENRVQQLFPTYSFSFFLPWLLVRKVLKALHKLARPPNRHDSERWVRAHHANKSYNFHLLKKNTSSLQSLVELTIYKGIPHQIILEISILQNIQFCFSEAPKQYTVKLYISGLNAGFRISVVLVALQSPGHPTHLSLMG